MKKRNALLCLAMLLLIAAGCKRKDDKADIVGIWQIMYNTIAGRHMDDGKGWFEFKADGKVDTRPRPGGYESGEYILDPEKGTMILRGADGELTYNYKLDGDTLYLDAKIPGSGFDLKVKCKRVDKHPITADQEPPEPELPPMMPEDTVGIVPDSLK